MVIANLRGGSMVYAGELADGYGDVTARSGKNLEPGEVCDRLLAGMIEHDRPLAMIAGDAGRHWEHASEVARELIARTTDKQMLLPSREREWIGVIVEVDPRSVGSKQVRELVHSLGAQSERLIVSMWAGGDVPEAERWVRALYPPAPSSRPPFELVMAQTCPQCDAKPGEKCVKPTGEFAFRPHPPRARATGYEPPPRKPVPALVIAFFEEEQPHARIMRVYRLLERREFLRGRGVVLLRRRRRLFSSP